MATVVQIGAKARIGNGTNVAPTLTGVTAGNTLILCLASAEGGTGDGIPNSITGATMTLAKRGPVYNTRAYSHIYYESNTAGGDKTVTVTFDAGSYIVASLIEVSGLDASPIVDAGGSAGDNAGGTNVPTSGTTGTITRTGIAIAVLEDGQASNPIGNHTPSGYTNIGVEQDSNAFTGYSADYKIVSSTGGTESVPGTSSGWGTLNAPEKYTACIALFADAAGGGGPASYPIHSDLYF